MDKGNNTRLAENLRLCVYKLAHDIGERSIFNYQALSDAAGYIKAGFESFGYDVELQAMEVYGKKVNNVIAVKRGTGRKDEVIIAGAHYDTCGNPGADDNASAIAGLLELARSVSDRRLSRTIKFIAFVNEEPPFFTTQDMGSLFYARTAKRNKENIKACLILEMIGYYSDKPNSQSYPAFLGFFYPNKGNFIAAVGNFSSRWLIRKIVRAFRDTTSFPIESIISSRFVPGADFSDHWSFWKEGYPAVMITDTAFYRNPHYHSNSDTHEKLNYENMAEVIRGLTGVLTDLAQ